MDRCQRKRPWKPASSCVVYANVQRSACYSSKSGCVVPSSKGIAFQQPKAATRGTEMSQQQEWNTCVAAVQSRPRGDQSVGQLSPVPVVFWNLLAGGLDANHFPFKGVGGVCCSSRAAATELWMQMPNEYIATVTASPATASHPSRGLAMGKRREMPQQFCTEQARRGGRVN